jgi:hypothetical protein
MNQQRFSLVDARTRAPGPPLTPCYTLGPFSRHARCDAPVGM